MENTGTGFLTTHVLDASRGLPGKGIKVELFEIKNSSRRLLNTVITNDDGRCDTRLLEGSSFVQGQYELVFHTASYFKSQGVVLEDPPFLDEVVIRFGVSKTNDHYHVPLLISPYSYSTYKGS